MTSQEQPAVADNAHKANPLRLYLARLAPSSQSTLRYVLQDAADRLGYDELNLEDIPWHHLQPEQVTALVATLRRDGYAPNTSSLYVNALRGVMNEAWRSSLISSYSSSYEQKVATQSSNPGLQAKVASYTQLDAQVSYLGLSNTELALSIGNLTDRDPPFDPAAGGDYFDTSLYNHKGRTWTLSASYQF